MGPSNLGDISYFFSFTVLKVVRNMSGVCGKYLENTVIFHL